MIPKNKLLSDPDYRSKFEQTVGEFLGELAEHEPERITFIQPSKQRYYIPDFKTKGGVYIESKGKWTAEDRSKHVWLHEQHPDKRIVLIFQNANVKLSKRSKTTYGEWATKNGLEWYNWKDGIPEHVYKTENNNNNANKLNSGNTRGSGRSKRKPKSGASTVPARSRAKRSTG